MLEAKVKEILEANLMEMLELVNHAGLCTGICLAV